MPEKTPETPKTNKTGLAIAAVVVVLVVILAVVKFTGKKNDSPAVTDTSTDTPTTNQTSEQPSPTNTGTYKDGTYTATGHYPSPGGPETIKITLTLKGGAVTDATAVPQAERPISKNFQNIFAQNFKTQVVGVNIQNLKLDKVSGSSLTPKGFNEAVEQIKTQAQTST